MAALVNTWYGEFHYLAGVAWVHSIHQVLHCGNVASRAAGSAKNDHHAAAPEGMIITEGGKANQRNLHSDDSIRNHKAASHVLRPAGVGKLGALVPHGALEGQRQQVAE